MILSAARRVSDGLIVGLQKSAAQPDAATIRQQAADSFGDDVLAWEYINPTPQQYNDALAALPGRSFLNGGNLSSVSPPQLSIEITAIGEVTVTCDVGDIGFTGIMAWECIGPSGQRVAASGPAVAGVDTWIIQTGQIGRYLVRVTAPEFGTSEIEFGDA